MVGDILGLTMEACSQGNAMVMGIVGRSLPQRKGNHYMDHVHIVDGRLRHTGVQLGGGYAVFLHILIKYMKVVFRNDIIARLAGAIRIRADHTNLMAFFPQCSDQVQGGCKMPKKLQKHPRKKGRMLKMTETTKMPLTNGNGFCIIEKINRNRQ